VVTLFILDYQAATLGRRFPKMELRKFPQSRKVHHPAKDPQSSNFSIEIKNKHSNYG
jgi:hypothetical protein